MKTLLSSCRTKIAAKVKASKEAKLLQQMNTPTPNIR